MLWEADCVEDQLLNWIMTEDRLQTMKLDRTIFRSFSRGTAIAKMLSRLEEGVPLSAMIGVRCALFCGFPRLRI
jgi:hypothetical protein